MSVTHRQIVDRHGVSSIAEALELPIGTVRMWQHRRRIPSEHWSALASAQIATLEELANAEREAVLTGARAA